MTKLKVLVVVRNIFFGSVISVCLLFVGIGCTIGEPEPEPTKSAPGESKLPPGTPGMMTVMPGEFESLLSGDVLSKYEELPEEYREALRAYLAFGVSRELIPILVDQKMAQWPAPPTPLKELLGQDRFEAIEEIIETKIREPVSKTLPYASFLLTYYIYVLNTQDTATGQLQAFSALADSQYGATNQLELEALADPQHGATDQSELEALADPQHGATNQSEQAPMLKPRLKSILVPIALSQLQKLGPNFRRVVESEDGDWLPQEPGSIAVYLLHSEIALLKAVPGLELPPIESSLTQEQLSEFKAFSPIVQNRVEKFYHGIVFTDSISLALYATSPALSLPSAESLSDTASYVLSVGKRFWEWN